MADEITFLHLSDTHLLADDGEVMGVRPARQLARVLARIAALPVAPRFCLHTGDLIHDSGVAGYARLRRLLAPLGVPLFAALGNHDDRAAFRAGFLGEAGGDDRHYYRAHDLDGLRVIVLDSLVPGAIHGELGREQLAWLVNVLAQPAPRGRLVALHHPVALTGFPWLADGLLRDAPALAAILARHPILGVLTGHCHAPSVAGFAGTLAVTAPAVACQFAPGRSETVITPESGFNLCTIREGALLVTPVMGEWASGRVGSAECRVPSRSSGPLAHWPTQSPLPSAASLLAHWLTGPLRPLVRWHRSCPSKLDKLCRWVYIECDSHRTRATRRFGGDAREEEEPWQ